jgi:hypothetical protein
MASSSYFLLLAAARAADCDGTVVEYEAKKRSSNIDAFDLRQVNLCFAPYSSSNDRTPGHGAGGAAGCRKPSKNPSRYEF